MGAVAYRASAELRQRWRSTLLLTLFVGVAGAVVLTTVAGARRSSTAYERFRDETLAGDLDVAPSEPDPAALALIGELPEVEVMTLTAFPFIVPAGSGMYPYVDFLAMASADDAFGRTIDRPRLASGRPPDPDRPDEMGITETFADSASLEVGDRVDFDSYAPEQFEQLFGSGGAGAPAGPSVTLTVTGIFQAPDFLSQRTGAFAPSAFLTPSFLEQRTDGMAVYPGGARVRLRDGERDAPAVVEAVQAIFPDDSELEIQRASEITAKIQDSLDVIVTGLLLAAAAAAIAGAVVIAQALGRHLTPDASQDRALEAVGMRRTQRASVLCLQAVPIALGGASVSVLLAVAASPLMPVGLAREAEPDRGFSVDPLALAVGALVIAIGVLGLSLVASWVATGAATARDGLAPGRPSWLQRVLTRIGLSPAGTVGVGFALDPRRAASVPVRSGLAAVAVGVGGMAAVAVFAASVTTLGGSGERFGFPWDAQVAGFDGTALEASRDDLVADPEVASLGVLTTSIARTGDTDVNVHALEALKGAPEPTLLSGRLPDSDDEVAAGTGTLDQVGRGVGDRLAVEGADGQVELRIVGRAAFPIVDDRSAVDHGLLLTAPALEDLVSERSINRDFVLRWAEGVDVPAANAALSERTGSEVYDRRSPPEVTNLVLVERIPRAVAGVLGAFALLTAAHLLATTVRRRRADLAVLRSLGFGDRDLTATVLWQATTVAVVALGIGLPLGVALGRTAWRQVAGRLGVAEQPTVPTAALAGIAVAVVLVVGVIALWPAWRARRIRPARALRSA